MLKSACQLFWIVCNCAILNFYQVLMFVLIRPFNRSLYKRLVSELITTPWVNIMSCIFPPSSLVVSGTIPHESNKPCIIIANHQVDADWWYIWQVAKLSQSAGNIKVVLKAQLKHVPIFGWGMQMMDFIFLKRDMTKDRAKIQRQMTEFSLDKFPFWLVIFPEGTTVHKEYVDKSQAFAKRTNRPCLQHTLLPRSGGLKVLLQAVKDIQPDIYDLTMAFSTYSGEIPTYDMGYDRNTDTMVPSVKKLLAGQSPAKVHVHGERFTYDQVSGRVEEWLDEQWVRKEQRLQEYIRAERLTTSKKEHKTAQTVQVPPEPQAIAKLWLSLILACVCLPLVLLIFFPTYTTWVVWRIWYAIYDKGTNSWIPYVLNLLPTNSA